MADKQLTNEVTTQAIIKARTQLREIMCENFPDTDFDFDGFIAGIVYWYEFQQLAKSYGKKILYFTPRKKKEEQ